MTVRGIPELNKVLDSLMDKEHRRVQRSALRSAGKLLVESAKGKVEYDENDPDGADGYHLRDNMRIQSEPKRSRTSEVQFRVGPSRVTSSDADRYGRSGYPIQGGLFKSSRAGNYAIKIEESKPFLRPAFDSTSDAMVAQFRKSLGKSLERIARREAKKNAVK